VNNNIKMIGFRRVGKKAAAVIGLVAPVQSGSRKEKKVAVQFGSMRAPVQPCSRKGKSRRTVWYHARPPYSLVEVPP